MIVTDPFAPNENFTTLEKIIFLEEDLDLDHLYIWIFTNNKMASPSQQ